MLVPLNLFHDIIFEEMIEEILSSHCRIYGIELMEVLGIEDVDEFQSAIAAAKRACATLNITEIRSASSAFLARWTQTGRFNQGDQPQVG